MENEELQSYERSPILRWGGLIFGFGFSFVAVQTIWTHGVRNWDWLQPAAFAMLAFSFTQRSWVERQGQLTWRSRVFWLAYGVFFGAWIGHQYGWVPGICIIALFALPSTELKGRWRSAGMKRPLLLSQLALSLVIAGWFVATVQEWVAFACIVTIILLLASEKQGRRSMRENLLRLKSFLWVATFALACHWAWRGPSFASILVLVAIPALWFGNLLMHLSAGERSFALPHPQS